MTSASRSAIATVVKFVLALGMVGMIDASATNSCSTPSTDRVRRGTARRITGIPPRPSIPDHELRARPRALGHALAEAGFDAWIAYGDDRAVAGPDHIRFLSDLPPHFEPVLLAARVEDA